MSFEGIPRPGQLTPYTDGMNPYAAANAARTDQAGKPLVKGLEKEQKIKSVTREDRQQDEAEDPQEQEQELFSEDEADQIRIFARLRGIMNFSLESGTHYEFTMNQATGLVELTSEHGDIVLTITPAEMVELSGKIQRYAGVLTDTSG